VTVAGVFSTGVPELDRRLVYTDIATAQKLLVSTRVSSLGVFLDRMAATGPAQQRLPRPAGLQVQTWVDQAVFYRSVRDLYNRIFGALGLIIGVIVVFVVANAMAMAVIERTREIGTLRALGTLPGQLVRSFALEGLLLGGVGAAARRGAGAGRDRGAAGLSGADAAAAGRSVGYPLQVAIDGSLYGLTLLAMLTLAGAGLGPGRAPHGGHAGGRRAGPCLTLRRSTNFPL
jgi:putative ABC transport system permease protein